MKAKSKKIVIAVVAAVLVVALAGTGVFFAVKNGGSAVKVALVSGMNQGGWGGNSEISDYGNVTTNLNQDIYSDDSLTITQIFVQEGDTVKNGDPLIAYDTTLATLELEMKQMEIDGLGLQMQSVQEEIKQLRATTPVSVNRSMAYSGADNSVGGNQASALKDDATYMNLSAAKTIPLAKETTSSSGEEGNPSGSEGNPPGGEGNPSGGEGNPPGEEENPSGGEGTTPGGDEKPSQPAIGSAFPEELRGKTIYNTITVDSQPYNQETADGTAENPYRFLLAPGANIDYSFMLNALDGQFVYVFEVVDDAQNPTLILYSWTLDGRQPQIEVPEEPVIPTGPTYEELQREIREKEEQLKTLSLDKRAAELELKQLQKKVNNGVVTSTVDGTVKSVLDEETARLQGSPIISVVGEDGFYITGTVSETALDRLPVGTPLMVTSWETGMQYEATVTSVSMSPLSGYYGNSANMSYYPFTAVIKGDAELRNGEGVQLSVDGMSSYMSSSDELYLDQMFVREEGNQYYVYKKGENGRLTKQYVEVGKIIYGSLEICSGLEPEDEIAFPYGKNVKEGAKTESVDSLYEYY